MNEEMNIDKTSPELLMGKFKTKEDLYTILTEHLQYYLPPYAYCPLSFMRGCLSGKKHMYLSYEIKKVNVPSYPELKVENFWKKIKTTPRYLQFFPDYKANMNPPREYLFNLLHTIDPELVENKIMESHNSRDLKSKLENEALIEIVPSLLKEILDTSYHSKVRGRTAFLMKKGAKLEFKRNKKSVRDIFEEDKDNHENEMK